MQLPPNVNGTPVISEPVPGVDTLTKDQATQARSFFAVMVKKNFDVDAMANTIGHMGAMLVEAAEAIAAKRCEGQAYVKK